MSDKLKLDYDKIARALHAEHRGTVQAGGGWFGATQLGDKMSQIPTIQDPPIVVPVHLRIIANPWRHSLLQ
jgi:hypothetical protein